MNMAENVTHTVAINCGRIMKLVGDDDSKTRRQPPTPPPYGKEQTQSYRSVEEPAAGAHWTNDAE